MFLILLLLWVAVAQVVLILPAVISLLFFLPFVYRGFWLSVHGNALSFVVVVVVVIVVVVVDNLLLDCWLSLFCDCARCCALSLFKSCRFVRFPCCYPLRLYPFPSRCRPWDYVVACLVRTVCTANLIIRSRRCLIFSYPDVIFRARHQLTFLFIHPVVLYPVPWGHRSWRQLLVRATLSSFV